MIKWADGEPNINIFNTKSVCVKRFFAPLTYQHADVKQSFNLWWPKPFLIPSIHVHVFWFLSLTWNIVCLISCPFRDLTNTVGTYNLGFRTYYIKMAKHTISACCRSSWYMGCSIFYGLQCLFCFTLRILAVAWTFLKSRHVPVNQHAHIT